MVLMLCKQKNDIGTMLLGMALGHYVYVKKLNGHIVVYVNKNITLS